MNSNHKIGSRIVHQDERFEMTKSHTPPLHLTSSFDFDSVEDSIDVFVGKNEGHVYARYGNPNIASIAQKIADLESFRMNEDARALFTTNGMSAIYTLLHALLNKGDSILTQGDLYGGSTELIQKVLNLTNDQIHFLDFRDLSLVEERLKKDTSISLIYLETPTNPVCSLVDLEKISALAEKYGCLTVVDNTFCTPYLQRPLELGIDFVVHSTTKYLNGHGTGLGGCIVGLRNHDRWDQIWDVMKLIGSTGSPLEAWMVSNGIKTLKLRMDQHCRNALHLAGFLSEQDQIIKVNYPGLKNHPQHKLACEQMDDFGGMLSFDVGSKEKAYKLLNHLKLATIAPTLGDVDTLVLHPATSSHLKIDPEICKSFGITEGLIRVSVGIEDHEDIIHDFDSALNAL